MIESSKPQLTHLNMSINFIDKDHEVYCKILNLNLAFIICPFKIIIIINNQNI